MPDIELCEQVKGDAAGDDEVKLLIALLIR